MEASGTDRFIERERLMEFDHLIPVGTFAVILSRVGAQPSVM